MIEHNHTNLSIRKQCEMLNVLRSNIYYIPKPVPDESILANEIHDLWLDMPFYGYRRITAELQRRGYGINHKRVLRMMNDMHIQALYPRKRTTVCNPNHKKYPYLLRDLHIKGPNHVWATDITYIKVYDGFVYLVGIIAVMFKSVVFCLIVLIRFVILNVIKLNLYYNNFRNVND